MLVPLGRNVFAVPRVRNPSMRDESIDCAAACCPICGGDGRPAKVLQAPDRFHRRTAIYDLVRCPSCSAIWVDNPPLPGEMDRHYGPDYHRLIASGAEASRDRWRSHRDTLSKYVDSGTLLDVGCSSGSFLASLPGTSWRLYGIEMGAASAERARNESGARVFTGDILDASFPNDSFDAITCFDVLEHLPEPRKVLIKIWNWLKPGGIFYTIVPNIDSAEARVFRSRWYPLELPRHLFHFSPASLGHLALSLGFEKIDLHTRRCCKVEYNLRYIGDDVLGALGLPRQPLATAPPPGIPWRVVRKVLRHTLFPLTSLVISLFGPGESIHAIFRKRGRSALTAAVNLPDSVTAHTPLERGPVCTDSGSCMGPDGENATQRNATYES